jgi:hypothetical protein
MACQIARRANTFGKCCMPDGKAFKFKPKLSKLVGRGMAGQTAMAALRHLEVAL